MCVSAINTITPIVPNTTFKEYLKYIKPIYKAAIAKRIPKT